VSVEKSRDAFRTISEVAEWMGTQPHVLRFWESKFSQVKPVKRAGGRRYYRPGDMALLSGIKTLLHEEGFTIKGVQKILRERGVKYVASLAPAIDGTTVEVDAPAEAVVIPMEPKAAVEEKARLADTAPAFAVPRQTRLPDKVHVISTLRQRALSLHKAQGVDLEPLIVELKALKARLSTKSQTW